jgi:tetratricopeptide (TPR) repeat protein
VKRVDRRDDLPSEQVGWFHYRLGELELRSGRLEAADSALHRGLVANPGDYRILGALARLESARGEWKRSVDYGNEAIAVQLDPATLGTVSAAWAALGDTAQAEQYARSMTVSALRQPGPIHRAWGLFLLDHGKPSDVDRVLKKIRVEARTRHDVYGDDLLGWALYRKGRFADADRAATRALRVGTEDAQLYYHAGMIALAVGDSARARTHLARSRELDPRFGSRQGAMARP